MDKLQIFAERFKELLEDNGWNFEYLEKKYRISHTASSRWARAVCFPCVEYLIDLADIFGVSTDYLLGRSDY